MTRQQTITAKSVRQAGQLVDRALESQHPSVGSPGLDELAAARREQDPVVRSQKIAAALQLGARDIQAACDRLSERKARNPTAPEDVQFTPEAQRELEALQEHIQVRIRRRAEEEIARAYPEQTVDKRRPPRRRGLSV